MKAAGWIVILSFAACGRGAGGEGERAVAAAAVQEVPGAGGGPVADATTQVGAVIPGGGETSPPAPAVPARVLVIERAGNPGGPIPYRVVEPADASAETPLVVALHGRGDTAAGFGRMVLELGLNARVFVGEGPLPWGTMGGRQWFEGSDAAGVRARVADVRALVRALREAYPKAGKPGIFGFSQGAMLALQVAWEAGGEVAAVAALSGFLVSEEGAGEGRVPVFISAGTQDGVVPQERSWAAAEAFSKRGYAVTRLPFVGPHRVPERVQERLRGFLMAELEPGAGALRERPE